MGERAECGPPPSTPAPWTAFLGRPLFWMGLLAVAWLLPLLKSLGATYPEPPAGFDRQGERFELLDLEGRRVKASDLAGYLLVIQPLRAASESGLAGDFRAFRELKDHLRSLGAMVVHVLLVRGGEPAALAEFVEGKKARKPNNLFLFDDDGALQAQLCESAGLPQAELFLLDRHGRLRAAYAQLAGHEAGFFRAITLLANWEGCDPAPGQPVIR